VSVDKGAVPLNAYVGLTRKGGVLHRVRLVPVLELDGSIVDRARTRCGHKLRAQLDPVVAAFLIMAGLDECKTCRRCP
jgi:hypothetical protein